MLRTSQRKCSKNNEDDEWNPKQKGKKECKKKNKYIGESCFIHCTESNEGLTKLPSLESWEKLLKVAKVRQNEKLLLLAKSITNEDEYPVIYYHLKCRNTFTHKGTLDAISKVSYDFFFNGF